MLRRNKPLTRKTPLKRNQKPIARKTRPKKQSAKQVERMAKYYPIRDAFMSLPENQDCRIRVEGVCAGQATDVHHPEGREGELLFMVKKFIPTCRFCHDYIGTHDEWAREQGFVLSRHSKNDPE